MSVWAIIDCEQKSFRTYNCLCCHLIPPVYLIPKDQQYERQREGQQQRENPVDFFLKCNTTNLEEKLIVDTDCLNHFCYSQAPVRALFIFKIMT